MQGVLFAASVQQTLEQVAAEWIQAWLYDLSVGKTQLHISHHCQLHLPEYLTRSTIRKINTTTLI